MLLGDACFLIEGLPGSLQIADPAFLQFEAQFFQYMYILIGDRHGLAADNGIPNDNKSPAFRF
jgi:hypothetical protein